MSEEADSQRNGDTGAANSSNRLLVAHLTHVSRVMTRTCEPAHQSINFILYVECQRAFNMVDPFCPSHHPVALSSSVDKMSRCVAGLGLSADFSIELNTSQGLWVTAD